MKALIVALGVALALPVTAAATPTFLTAINISDAGNDGFEPQVGVAPDGTVIAVWTHSDGTNFRIQSSNRTPNGAWQTTQTLSDPGVSASGPTLAVDSSGNAVAAWVQSDGVNSRITFAYRPAGGSFGAPVLVSQSGADASAPDVSVDASGNVLLAWQRTDGTNLRVQATTRSPGVGGAFGAIQTLSVAGQDAYQVKVAAGPAVDANGVAVWTRSDGTKLRVQSARRLDVLGYPRPRGATPFRVPLVPAFKQCTSPNRTHGAALAFPSCAPPAQTSNVLTVGTPDSNGQATNLVGSVVLNTIPAGPNPDINDADVGISVAITDVRNNPSLTDYVGNVTLNANLQITDRNNTLNPGDLETPQTATVQTLDYQAPVSCTSTVSTTVGSTCTLATTANALVPGTVVKSMRSIWEIGQVEIRDPGPDGIAGNADDVPFLRQGLFVP